MSSFKKVFPSKNNKNNLIKEIDKMFDNLFFRNEVSKFNFSKEELLANYSELNIFYLNLLDNNPVFLERSGNLINVVIKDKKNKKDNNLNFFMPVNFLSPLRDINLDKERGASFFRFYEEIEKFINNFSTKEFNKGFYISGGLGVGKTFLSGVIANEIIKKGFTVSAFNFSQLVTWMQGNFNYNNNKNQKIINTFKHSDLLIIDDLGSNTLNQWSRDDFLLNILEYRMNNLKPIIITSNYQLDNLKSFLEDTKNFSDEIKAQRILERIKFLTNDFILEGMNSRRK